MFRDPIFSLKMARVERICDLIHEAGLKISWICETHPRFLTPKLIERMASAGCTAVKLGIESGNRDVLDGAQRAAVDFPYQEEIIACLERNGIDVLAFYVLGYFDDTDESILETIDYARHLNTYGAQFSIATPYPGTPWYEELRTDPKFQLEENLEAYNQYRLVYNHPNLGYDQLERLKSLAYQRYYLRWSYILEHIWRRNLSKRS
jgi:radical SAM superfamily enzyme YgiQ (UPF0313 family)